MKNNTFQGDQCGTARGEEAAAVPAYPYGRRCPRFLCSALQGAAQSRQKALSSLKRRFR